MRGSSFPSQLLVGLWVGGICFSFIFGGSPIGIPSFTYSGIASYLLWNMGKERRLGYIWAWVVFFIDIRLDVYCNHLCFLELFPKHGEMIYSHDKRSLSQLKKLCYVQSNVYANYTLHVSLDASLTPKQLEKASK